MAEQQRFVVSESTFVKNNKVGTSRRSSSASAIVDAITSDRVEETPTTKTYVKTFYNPKNDFRPSAPPSSDDRTVVSESTFVKSNNVGTSRRPPSVPVIADAITPDRVKNTPTTKTYIKKSYSPQNDFRSSSIVQGDIVMVRHNTIVQEDDARTHQPIPLGFLLVFMFSIFLFTTYAVVDTHSEVTLLNASWDFRGQVSQLKSVEEEDWMLPDGATSIDFWESVKTYKTVVERVDHVCADKLEMYDVFSHYENICKKKFARWEKTEDYSHTKRTCYSDGVCEDKDVYNKKDKAVYETVCEKEPRYKKAERTVLSCKDVPITREDPVFGTRWKYTIDRWIPLFTVSMNSNTHRLEDVYTLEPLHKYMTEDWVFTLFFGDSTTVNVNRTVFDKHKDLVGQKVKLKRHWFGFWKSLE